jgi:ABC-type transport system substrate-binding protein
VSSGCAENQRPNPLGVKSRRECLPRFRLSERTIKITVSFHFGVHKSTLALVLVLFLFMMPVVQPMISLKNSKVAAASGSPCPSSQTLRVSIPGGAPPSYNFFTIFSDAQRFTLTLMYLSMTPNHFANGSLYWGGTVSNWIRWNSNYTTWTFHMKPGLKWSDGSAVTTADVVNTFSSKFAFNASFDVFGIGSMVTSIRPINADTVVFNLNTPDAILDDQLADAVLMPAVMPPSYVSQGPATSGFGTLVTDGPFYLANYTAGSTQAVLLRNPYFQPQPKACEILLNFPESKENGAIFLSGDETDLAYITEADVSVLHSNPNLGTVVIPGLASEWISWNITRPPYNNLNFRQALAHAINMSEVNQVGFEGLGTTSEAAQGTVSPSSGLYSKNQQKYNYNTTEALALLKQDGITMGGDGHLQWANGTDVTLTLYVETDDVGVTLSGTTVANDLSQLGFKVLLITESKGTMIGATYQNTNNIWSAMILSESIGAVYGNYYFTALPAASVYSPFAAYPTWDGPAGSVAENNYRGNLSALESTRIASQQQNYLNNIQLLNSQNLPVLFLVYPAVMFGYNTRHWTGWSSNFLAYEPIQLNLQFFSTLSPLGQASSTTFSSATSSSASSSSATSSLVTSSSTSSSTTSGSDILTIALTAVVVVVIVVIGAAYVMRRRRKP